jgi:MYXO-CTERM domain-containing protein
VTATPEPASLTLMATGFLGLGGVAVRRRRKA